jgi:hypothetical protein
MPRQRYAVADAPVVHLDHWTAHVETRSHATSNASRRLVGLGTHECVVGRDDDVEESHLLLVAVHRVSDEFFEVPGNLLGGLDGRSHGAGLVDERFQCVVHDTFLSWSVRNPLRDSYKPGWCSEVLQFANYTINTSVIQSKIPRSIKRGILYVDSKTTRLCCHGERHEGRIRQLHQQLAQMHTLQVARDFPSCRLEVRSQPQG